MAFKKGQSGNPAGRPKNTPMFSDEMRRLLACLAPGSKQTNLRYIVSRFMALAREGDKDVIKYLCDRLEGRPAQALELTGDEARPVTFRYADGNKEA